MMTTGEIWDGPGDGYYPDQGDDQLYDEYDDYARCTRCSQPVYYNGSSPETTILMHSNYPADGHDPQL